MIELTWLLQCYFQSSWQASGWCFTSSYVGSLVDILDQPSHNPKLVISMFASRHSPPPLLLSFPEILPVCRRQIDLLSDSTPVLHFPAFIPSKSFPVNQDENVIDSKLGGPRIFSQWKSGFISFTAL